MRATLSIMGLYNWDETLFDNMVLPTGVNKELAINSIVFDNAELEILYPEPETMKLLIGVWSKSQLPIWNRIKKAIEIEYNPLENYNRTETWSDTESENAKNTGSENEVSKNTQKVNTENSGTSNTTHKVSGYNGESLVNANSDNASMEEAGESTTTLNGNRDTTKTEKLDRDKTLKHSGNTSGNIGVTTSQQMLEQELNIVNRLDIYHYISESFKKRFCLMVY